VLKEQDCDVHTHQVVSYCNRIRVCVLLYAVYVQRLLLSSRRLSLVILQVSAQPAINFQQYGHITKTPTAKDHNHHTTNSRPSNIIQDSHSQLNIHLSSYGSIALR
jgi:hypothetical protein